MLELWNTGWTALHPSDVPVVFDNEAALAVDAWARLSIVHTVRRQATMGPRGARRFASQGRIAVQIFVPSNTGTELANQLADDARLVLEGTETIVASQPLCIYAGASGPNLTDGRWLMKLVTLPFTYYGVS